MFGLYQPKSACRVARSTPAGFPPTFYFLHFPLLPSPPTTSYYSLSYFDMSRNNWTAKSIPDLSGKVSRPFPLVEGRAESRKAELTLFSWKDRCCYWRIRRRWVRDRQGESAPLYSSWERKDGREGGGIESSSLSSFRTLFFFPPPSLDLRPSLKRTPTSSSSDDLRRKEMRLSCS